jgi:hypothetical protein
MGLSCVELSICVPLHLRPQCVCDATGSVQEIFGFFNALLKKPTDSKTPRVPDRRGHHTIPLFERVSQVDHKDRYLPASLFLSPLQEELN